jgi:hypothetical protein
VPFGATVGVLETIDDTIELRVFADGSGRRKTLEAPSPKPPSVPTNPPWNRFSTGSLAPK